MNIYHITIRVSLLAFFYLHVVGEANAHDDVLVANVGGQTTIGAAADIGGPSESFDLTTRVFETILVPGFSPTTPA